MPLDNDRHPDIANAVVYRKDDRLYVIDTGVGAEIRSSLARLIEQNSPMGGFYLLNSHGHIDHAGNNDLILDVQAEHKHHYLSERGVDLLETNEYFAGLFHELSLYYDLFAGFQAHRLKYWAAALLLELLTPFVGREAALRRLVPLGTKKFKPAWPSRETIQFYETMSKEDLIIGKAAWTGRSLEEGEVLVLEDRGHSPDHVLFYVPEFSFLFTADATFEYLCVWPDSDRKAARETLCRCLAMAQDGEVKLLADSHHHRVYEEPQSIADFVNSLLQDDEAFLQVLAQILGDEHGLAVPQIHARLTETRYIPVAERYLQREFPHSPPSLQAVILLALLDMGCCYEGPGKNKRFHPGRCQALAQHRLNDPCGSNQGTHKR
jgi:glyoxylase-like metal-dependent hydrolase (beta-lactamase superfamily II)